RTPAAEVWIRPCDSVTGTRWTRWTPPSNFVHPYTPSWEDLRARVSSRTPPSSVCVASRISVVQPREAAQRSYMRARSEAKRADSSPPSPARISRIASRPSSGSEGTRRSRRSTSRSSRSSARDASSSWASSANEGSASASSWAAATSSLICCSRDHTRARRSRSAYRRVRVRARPGRAWTCGSASSCSTCACSSRRERTVEARASSSWSAAVDRSDVIVDAPVRTTEPRTAGAPPPSSARLRVRCRSVLVRGRLGQRRRLLHLEQELCVRRRLLELRQQQLDRLLLLEAGQEAAQLPHDLALLGPHEVLLAAGAGAVDIDSGEDPLVRQVAGQAQLH